MEALLLVIAAHAVRISSPAALCTPPEAMSGWAASRAIGDLCSSCSQVPGGPGYAYPAACGCGVERCAARSRRSAHTKKSSFVALTYGLGYASRPAGPQSLAPGNARHDAFRGGVCTAPRSWPAVAERGPSPKGT